MFILLSGDIETNPGPNAINPCSWKLNSITGNGFCGPWWVVQWFCWSVVSSGFLVWSVVFLFGGQWSRVCGAGLRIEMVCRWCGLWSMFCGQCIDKCEWCYVVLYQVQKALLFPSRQTKAYNIQASLYQGGPVFTTKDDLGYWFLTFPVTSWSKMAVPDLKVDPFGWISTLIFIVLTLLVRVFRLRDEFERPTLLFKGGKFCRDVLAKCTILKDVYDFHWSFLAYCFLQLFLCYFLVLLPLSTG